MSDSKSAPTKGPAGRPATEEELAAIRDIVLERDTDAFATGSWEAVEQDFDGDVFVGYEGGSSPSETWGISFPDLAAYREAWLGQSEEMRAIAPSEQIAAEIRGACRIAEVKVNGDRALVRKQFDGVAVGRRLLWETYYFLRRDPDRWRITGFVGYLPYQPAA